MYERRAKPIPAPRQGGWQKAEVTTAAGAEIMMVGHDSSS
jgi:hypothetical protein